MGVGVGVGDGKVELSPCSGDRIGTSPCSCERIGSSPCPFVVVAAAVLGCSLVGGKGR